MNILIAEDIDSIALGLGQHLETTYGKAITCMRYCDEALLRLRRAASEGNPFELLITDLSFSDKGLPQELTGGEALVAAARKWLPELKVIVYSVEDRIPRIRRCFEQLEIDGYVCKGRESLGELLRAIEAVGKGERHLPKQFPNLFQAEAVPDLTDYDVTLLRLLADGMSQADIARHFKARGEAAASNSSVEKRLNRLRTAFGAHNAVHLVSLAKDMDLI